MKTYVLYSHKRKKNRRASLALASAESINGENLHAEEALLDFKPDKNQIDGKLYDGIVEAPIIRKAMRLSADVAP